MSLSLPARPHIDLLKGQAKARPCVSVASCYRLGVLPTPNEHSPAGMASPAGRILRRPSGPSRERADQSLATSVQADPARVLFLGHRPRHQAALQAHGSLAGPRLIAWHWR